MGDHQLLTELSSLLRFKVIENSAVSGTPHLGSCLSCIDLLVALYFDELKINHANPSDPLRDRFILSKGHAAPALFQVLAKRGFYPESWLSDYGKDGGIFSEHPPSPNHLVGIEAATGSLGHGLPMGLGMAMASRIQKYGFNVYVLLGDGECNEGTVWEAAMLASAQKISNLCVLIDFNKWQATGRSEEIMHLNSLREKWKAFGWNSIEIDGHNFNEILFALKEFRLETEKPTAIIAHTVKGKGVSFMQDDNNWHYRIPTVEEVKNSKIELDIKQ
jgi:transketolase